jgi:hypothetical protein
MLKHGSKTRLQEEGQRITQHQYLKKGDARISPLRQSTLPSSLSM